MDSHSNGERISADVTPYVALANRDALWTLAAQINQQYA